MKQKNGNNISKKFLQSIILAKETAEEINNIVNNSLSKCIETIKKSSNIKDVLNNELILLQNFDINIYNNSEKKIDNRVNLCHTALEEYELFNNNKELYLEKTYKRNMFSPKEIDLTKDTLFEQSVKKLIINLGNEKNALATSPQLVELYELRQDKLRDICKEFTQMRQNFLSQHIKQEHTINKTLEKKKSLEH